MKYSAAFHLGVLCFKLQILWTVAYVSQHKKKQQPRTQSLTERRPHLLEKQIFHVKAVKPWPICFHMWGNAVLSSLCRQTGPPWHLEPCPPAAQWEQMFWVLLSEWRKELWAEKINNTSSALLCWFWNSLNSSYQLLKKIKKGLGKKTMEILSCSQPKQHGFKDTMLLLSRNKTNRNIQLRCLIFCRHWLNGAPTY